MSLSAPSLRGAYPHSSDGALANGAGSPLPRVMAAALSAASLRLGSMARNRQYGHPSEDWDGMMIQPWRDHRDNLAIVLKHPEAFEDVATAFGLIISAISIRNMLFEGDGFAPDSKESRETTETLVGYKDTIDKVLPILRRVSIGRWERRRRRIVARFPLIARVPFFKASD